MQADHGQAVGFAHPDVARTLANKIGTWRDNNFRDTCLGCGKVIRKSTQLRTLFQSKPVYEMSKIIRVGDDAQDHTGLDIDITCQCTRANPVGLPRTFGGDNTYPVLRFHIIELPANQVAAVFYHQFRK